MPWLIEENSLAKELNLNHKSVRLINDLEAIARAVPILRPSDMVKINLGEPVRKGAVAVIAPGAGLGESFLTWDGSHYMAHGSEGGHSDFAPTDERQIRLLTYMLKQFDHVSFEHVCSGIGIPNIYRFLRDVEHIPEPLEVAKLIDTAADPSVVIINPAVDPTNRSKLCAETLGLLVSILGSEAGNLAAKFLATGGVYLAGGVAVHALQAIKQPDFLERFKRKGRFAELMSRIPIHVVVTPAGLAGAACLRAGEPHSGSRDQLGILKSFQAT